MRHYYHGDTGTRLYRIWKSMKCRCLNSNHPTYKYYGGRGILISDEWVENYPAFKTWSLANGYAADLELDRIDVNGSYTPENCRWITHHEQTLNRRNTLYVVFENRVEKVHDVCATYHINLRTFTGWRSKGIDAEMVSRVVGAKVRIQRGKGVMKV